MRPLVDAKSAISLSPFRHLLIEFTQIKAGLFLVLLASTLGIPFDLNHLEDCAFSTFSCPFSPLLFGSNLFKKGSGEPQPLLRDCSPLLITLYL